MSLPGPSANQQDILLWQAFLQKTKSLRGDQTNSRIGHQKKLTEISTYSATAQQIQAANNINHWWKKLRSSQKIISFNLKGNHPDEFFTYLNLNAKHKKKFSHRLDGKLLSLVQAGKWADILGTTDYRASADNLFAADKITWHQHATLSHLLNLNRLKSIKVHALIRSNGEFSSWFLKVLTAENYPKNKIESLKRIIKLLPSSERFGFTYNEDREFSFGVHDQIGLLTHGIENWFALVMTCRSLTIEDVDYYLLQRARPTNAVLPTFKVKVHGFEVTYDEYHSHDLNHREILVLLGNNVWQALNRIIRLGRALFGFRWSKDLWKLRDCGFVQTRDELRDNKQPSTDKIKDTIQILVNCLSENYERDEVQNCSQFIQDHVETHTFLHDGERTPNQLACCFALDLVLNPIPWAQFDIVAIESYFWHANSNYGSLLMATKWLNECGFLTLENSKLNVLKLDFTIRNPDLTIAELKEEFLKIEQNIGQYIPVRKNDLIFLGFTRDAQKPSNNPPSTPATDVTIQKIKSLNI